MLQSGERDKSSEEELQPGAPPPPLSRPRPAPTGSSQHSEDRPLWAIFPATSSGWRGNTVALNMSPKCIRPFTSSVPGELKSLRSSQIPTHREGKRLSSPQGSHPTPETGKGCWEINNFTWRKQSSLGYGAQDRPEQLVTLEPPFAPLTQDVTLQLWRVAGTDPECHVTYQKSYFRFLLLGSKSGYHD